MPDLPEKLDLRSHDIAGDKVQELLRLFPEIRTEAGKIDLNRLKLVLGETVDGGKERYGMNWPGKAECFKTIQAPSLGTLRPCPEESVNWDTTENLIIEGDNLEVLKLLQKAYLGKVKMIYIDPPYNTGNDFIYPDNYAESLRTYLEYTGQVDAEGRKFSTNTEADGRFHSRWLNMMYPRLYLAKNLLRDDGMIVISIDEHEADNLRKLGCEIFGEENFVGQVTVVNNLKGRNDKKNIALCHEYVQIFAKPDFIGAGLPLTEEQRAEYANTDKDGDRYALRDLRKRGSGDRREDRPKMYFPIYLNQKTKQLCLERKSRNDVEILPLRGDGSDGRWRWGKERVSSNLEILESRFTERSEKWGLDYRVYLNPKKAAKGTDEIDDDDEGEERTSKPKSFWMGPEFSTDVARRAFKSLMPECDYDFPKATEFVKRCIQIGMGPNDLVMDFFVGSGTTGQAVLELNAMDGGNRNFILVQLPEPTEQKKYPTIAEITKERIRRSAKKLNQEQAKQLALGSNKKIDRGFRVFKLAESNFASWNAGVPHDQGALVKQLVLHVDHLRDDRSPEDILYELLLKSGFPVTVAVEKVTMAGKTVYSIAGGAFLICLERELTLELMRAMAAKQPERVVCLDEGFAGNDQLKVNAVQAFKTKGVKMFRTV